MNPAAVGDALNIPESIKLDAPYRERRRAKRMLKFAQVNVLTCMFYNRGIFSKGLIVVVERHHGSTARQVLAHAGYREIA